MELLSFTISFLASVIGTICGIGGGVIIKPVLDASGILSISVINFLSGCTVLSMSLYSVIKTSSNQDADITRGLSAYLGIGAVIGGIGGKQVFQMLKIVFGDEAMVGAVQAAALAVITLGTLIYICLKKKIRTLNISNGIFALFIGLMLGGMSSFLGIGGGPINLVLLHFFFSMETKAAAQNSLYIICLSQLSNLIITILKRAVPAVSFFMLAGMIICACSGSFIGQKINARISSAAVDKLFIVLICIIIMICIYNVIGSGLMF